MEGGEAKPSSTITLCKNLHLYKLVALTEYHKNQKDSTMSRLTIEITEQQHQSIKALAAMQGKSIKEYVMQRLLPLTPDEEQAMQELEDFLKPRIEAVERGEIVSTSVMTIFKETLAASKP